MVMIIVMIIVMMMTKVTLIIFRLECKASGQPRPSIYWTRMVS